MNQLFQQIRLFGVQGISNRSDIKTTILLNEIIFSLIIVEFVLYPEFILKGDTVALLIVFTTQFFTLIPLILTYFNKPQIAKWYFNLVFTSFMTIMIMIHGQELRADFCYLIFGVTAILFFEKWWQRSLLYAFIIFCYFFSLYYTNHYPAIFAHKVTPLNSSIVFLAILLCVAIIIGRFVRESHNYERRQNDFLKQLEEQQKQIQKQNHKLERANDDLERFAYMASHDLKSPLRNIGSFIGLIKRKTKQYDDQNLKEYLGFVDIGVQQMSQLIEDILEYSKIGSDDEIESEEVNLQIVLSQVKSQLKHFIKEKNAQIECTSLPIISANSTQMLLLFQNLIENGIKYNESEEPLISIYYYSDEEFHHFSFQDNGIGIAPEFQKRIFVMFKRLHSQAEYQGTGIGLSICKKIVERHGGEIDIKSENGEGSTFAIKLPVTVANFQ